MADRKRGYYICYETAMGLVGVQKKIDNQIKILNERLSCEKIEVPREKKNPVKSILWRMPLGSFGRQYESVFDKIQGKPDYFYIRFVPVDRRFLNFIKRLRESYPKAKILMEIPTYPYKKELTDDITMRPFYFKDLFYHGKLKKYIDRIVSMSDEQEIFGIPTIKIINGIIVDEVAPIQSCSQNTDSVVLIAVAYMQKTQGYERILRGLGKYYAEEHERNVELMLVGDGPELIRYLSLCKKYQIEERVRVCGRKEGTELSEIYEMADIAVSTLGGYKVGIDVFSSIKTREYLAKGLPMIIGSPIDVFRDKDMPYYLEFPNDDSVIDIEKIVQFCDTIYQNRTRQEVVDEIRQYAYEMVDMKKVLKPIIEYIIQES